MVDLASSARTGGEDRPRPGRPPLRPSWLFPLLAFGVAGVHVAFFASGVYWPDPQVADLGAINAELIPEGDSLDAGELAPEGDSLDVPPTAEAAAPAEPEPEPEPVLENPEAAAPPVKQKVAEKAKPVDKKRSETRGVEKARGRQATSGGRGQGAGGSSGLRYGIPGGRGQGTGTARVAGRYGLPGGRGQGAAATQAACLVQVAGSIRRHLPSVTSLGPGSANVTFYVNSGGGISGISVSASTPAHAALARRIVASSRGPATCGSSYASQHITFQ